MAGADLPDVNVGNEIEVFSYSFFGDTIVKKAGISLTQRQFDIIMADLLLMDTTGITRENIAEFIYAEVYEFGVETLASLEAEIRELSADPFFGPYLTDFTQPFNNWLRPIKNAAGRGIAKVYGFVPELIIIETDNWDYLENLHGGRLNLLLEIPEEMLGDYDYFMFGISADYDFDTFDIKFSYVRVNNGNALSVIDGQYISVSVRTLGEYGLVAFPKACDEPYISGDVNNDGVVNSMDALEILKYELGLPNAITDNPRALAAADVNNDGVVDSLDALEILKIELGIN
jgi:hypothetical protein